MRTTKVPREADGSTIRIAVIQSFTTTLQKPNPEDFIVNSTENLMDKADSLLSRYRRAPADETEPSDQSMQSDFPILTEVVTDLAIEALVKSEAAAGIDGESATSPHQQSTVDAIDQIAVELRHQLELAISEAISARLEALSSELVAAVLKVSLEALDEAARKCRTTDSPDPEGCSGRKQ